jgi:type VI secretion system secreted protein VgrG
LDGGINLFSYVGNNPAHLTDGYGLWAGLDDLAFAGGGALVGLAGQGIGDLVSGSWSGWEKYTASAIGGAVGGETLLYTANPFLAGAAGGATTNLVAQGLERLSGKRKCISLRSLTADTVIGTATGFIPGTGKLVPGITSGRGSFVTVAKQMSTKLASGQIQNVSASTATKMMVGQFMDKGMLPGAGAAAVAGVSISGYLDDCSCK